MMTVVDHVNPWLIPKSTLAMMTKVQLAAQTSERDSKGDQPARHQDWLSTEPVRPRACKVVRRRLRDPESDDEREPDAVGREVERASREERKNRSFLAEHAADQDDNVTAPIPLEHACSGGPPLAVSAHDGDGSQWQCRPPSRQSAATEFPRHLGPGDA